MKSRIRTCRKSLLAASAPAGVRVFAIDSNALVMAEERTQIIPEHGWSREYFSQVLLPCLHGTTQLEHANHNQGSSYCELMTLVTERPYNESPNSHGGDYDQVGEHCIDLCLILAHPPPDLSSASLNYASCVRDHMQCNRRGIVRTNRNGCRII